LQIVQQIVEQLGAEIAIDSEGRGKGVEVRLSLPVS
jgi:signal transduction histidine kinase